MNDDADDMDDFWAIAMMKDDKHNNNHVVDRHDDDDDDDENDCKIVKYSLPDTSVTLELQALPAKDGVWSPVGADAWYASALLTSLLLLQEDEEESSSRLLLPSSSNNDDFNHDDSDHHPLSWLFSMNKNHHQNKQLQDNNDNNKNRVVVLELGSGAVGLPGLASAVALQQKQQNFEKEKINWKVILTDNDRPVLDQLRRNVQANRPRIMNMIPHDQTQQQEEEQKDQHIQVEYLDWSDFLDLRFLEDQNDNENNILSSSLLVISSELVYTESTGKSCLQLLRRLFERYNHSNNVRVWIVQVTDRYGWKEIVLPGLMSEEDMGDGLTVKTYCPIPAEIHAMAATMIPMGGTLDRDAYGAYCIYKK